MVGNRCIWWSLLNNTGLIGLPLGVCMMTQAILGVEEPGVKIVLDQLVTLGVLPPWE